MTTPPSDVPAGSAMSGVPEAPGQGEPFPDPLFDDGFEGMPDRLVGFRGLTACQVVGITYRQLDYWRAPGWSCPSIRGAAGSGSQRLYSFKDVLVLKIVKRLLDAGVSLQNIRVAVEHLRRRGIRDLAGITLFSDGTTVYECSSPEEVDLLQGGQGVFGIAVERGDAGDQSIRDFSMERADGGRWTTPPRTSSSRRRTRRAKSADRGSIGSAGCVLVFVATFH